MSQTARCSLDSIGVLRIGGADARAFLHAQTTQNIADLAENEATLAAWLTPKGRVKALFDIISTSAGFLLLLPRDQIEPVRRQLGLFVLRSAVELEPLADVAVEAVVGDAGDRIRTRGIEPGPRTVHAVDGLTLVGIGPGLIHAIGAPNDIETQLSDVDRADADAAGLAEIRLGRPWIPRALSERYIPQMLNLDVLDAVSFEKGCYPGQEIVARTRHRGAVKRRLARFGIDNGARPESGDEIIADDGPAGDVNRVAAADSGYELLAVVRLDALDGPLALASDRRPLRALSTAEKGV